MLYGRASEQAAIAGLLDQARVGRAGTLVIRGPAGVGKSALLGYADRLARREADAKVLRVTGLESEAQLPYAALHLLLRPALAAIDTLPGPQADAIRGAFGMAPAVAGDRFLVGLATLGLIAELSPDGPLVCLVDDAQWLDRESMEALLFAVRRLFAEQVAVVFATRSEDTTFAAPGVPVLPLAGLAQPDAEQLVAASAPGLALAVRDQIVAESAGNPLALLELSRGLTDRQREGWLAPLAVSMSVAESPSSRVQTAFAERIGALPEASRWAVLVAALDSGGDLDGLSRALGGSLTDLAAAERAGLLRVTPEGVVFHHPLVRTAVRAACDIEERLAAHRALADVREGDQRAWHRAAMTVSADEQVAEELAAAGRRAAERGGLAAASVAFERAAELSPQPAARTTRLASAAVAAFNAGQSARAGYLADRATQLSGDPDLVAEVAPVRAALANQQRRPLQAAGILVDAVAGRSGIDPAAGYSMLCDASGYVWSATTQPGQAELIERIAAAAEAIGTAADGRPRAMVTFVENMRSYLLAGDLDRLVRTAFEPGADISGAPYPLRVLQFHADVIRADLSAQRARGERLVAQSRAAGMVGRLPQLLTLLSAGYALAGDYRQAADTVVEARRIAADTGQTYVPGYLDGIEAWLAAARGEEQTCNELIAQAREASGGTLLPPYAWAELAEARLHLGLGRYEEALGVLQRAETGPARHSFGLLYTCSDQVEAAVRAGRPAQARAPLERLTTWADAAGQDWARALASRSAALLATGDRADAGYQRALDLFPTGDFAFEQARTRLLYGEFLRRQKRRAGAREQLQAAAEIFDRLGARPWYARTVAELRAAGVVLPRRPSAADPLATLTAQELQVVRLAAAGASNREIGAQLFLSPRTVGYHLYKAYPKLGVSSRGELAKVLPT